MPQPMGFLIPMADRLKQARINAGLTQTELAEALNMNKGTWQNIEKGKKKIKPGLLVRFCDLTNTEPLEICLEYEKHLIRRILNERESYDGSVISSAKISNSGPWCEP